MWTSKAASIGGYHYFVTFIDDDNRKVWMYFMKKKSEVFGHFKAFKAMVEKETGLQIKCLRSEGGGEYLSNEFARFLQEHGIKQQYSCSHTPQQNGIAERKNRHIGEVSRACSTKIIRPVRDVLLGLMQAEKVIGRDNVVVVGWFYPGE